jgi:hypothetical protein
MRINREGERERMQTLKRRGVKFLLDTMPTLKHRFVTSDYTQRLSISVALYTWFALSLFLSLSLSPLNLFFSIRFDSVYVDFVYKGPVPKAELENSVD